MKRIVEQWSDTCVCALAAVLASAASVWLWKTQWFVGMIG
jgi:hypothetical protein